MCSLHLITCVIAPSNPLRLLPTWREKLRGHYHVTMTSDNDFCVWRWHYREHHSRISVNAQTIARNAPRIRALITSRNDRYVWTDQNSFTGMSTEMIKNGVFFVFLSKNTHKTDEIVKVSVINDNNNFAPSLFRSLCEFVGDCFGPRYFSEGAQLPQKNTSVQNNHLRFNTMASKKMVRSCLNNWLFPLCSHKIHPDSSYTSRFLWPAMYVSYNTVMLWLLQFGVAVRVRWQNSAATALCGSSCWSSRIVPSVYPHIYSNLQQPQWYCVI